MITSRAEILVCGKVQGVYFRESTRRSAVELRLVGEVRNLDDGCVQVIAEGENSALKRLIEYLHIGPERAVVSRVDVTWKEPSGEFSSFSVLR